MGISCYKLHFFLSVSFVRIDHKVSSTSHGYKLHDAQVILKEVKNIKDAISSGEKEKQELMQVKHLQKFMFMCMVIGGCSLGLAWLRYRGLN